MSKYKALIDARDHANANGWTMLVVPSDELRALLADLERAEKALAALAQQAQPVANDRDCPHCNYTGSMHCGDVAKTHGGILNPKACSHAKLFGSRITTPPSPQPAPVDDRDAEIAELRKEVLAWREQCDRLTHQVICCGVAASHPDATLTTRGAYAGKWNSGQAEEVRKLRAERDALAALSQPAPSPQAPGRRKGPPGITLEPQGHEQPAAPVVPEKRTVDPRGIVETADSGYVDGWNACIDAILALRPAVEPMTPGQVESMARKHAGDPSCSGAWGSTFEFEPSELLAFTHEAQGITAKAEGVRDGRST